MVNEKEIMRLKIVSVKITGTENFINILSQWFRYEY